MVRKVDELRGMSTEELLERLKEVDREMFLLNVKRLTGATEKTHLPRELKREKARILTILRERGVKI